MPKKSKLVSKLFGKSGKGTPTIPLVSAVIRQGRPAVSPVRAVKAVTRTLTASGDAADAPGNSKQGKKERSQLADTLRGLRRGKITKAGLKSRVKRQTKLPEHVNGHGPVVIGGRKIGKRKK